MRHPSTPIPISKLYRQLGDVYLTQEQWQPAADCYRQAIAHQVQDHDVYTRLAIALQGQHQHEAALESYQTALDVDPNQAAIYNNMGRSLVFMDRVEAAIAAYRRAIELKPGFELAHINLGQLWQQQGYHHQAIACFQMALKYESQQSAYRGYKFSGLGPQEQQRVITNTCMGVSWLALGEAQRAIAYFRQAIQPQRGLIDAYCRMYQPNNQPTNDALTLARSAGVRFLNSLLSPDSKAAVYLANAYRHWGNLLIQDGGRSQQQQAEQFYTRALQIDPSLADVYPNLANCLRRQGRRTAALLVEQTASTLVCGGIGKKLTSNGSEQSQALDSTYSLPPEVSPESPDSSSSPCAGLNCATCLQAIAFAYAPKPVAPGVYELTGVGLDRDRAVTAPLDIVTLPQGQCWVAPYESVWKICNAIAVFDREDNWIASRSREYPGQLPNCPEPSPSPERAIARHQYPIQSIAGRVAVVSGLSGHVYFHWMIDILPRLGLLQQAGIDLASLDGIVVNSRQRPFQHETLRLFGVPEERIIESDRHPHIQADELIVPPFQGSLGWAQPWTLKLLRDRILSHAPTQSGYPKRIYISRADAAYRKVLNESKWVEQLTAEGFVSIELAGRSVVEQAALFHHADVIIAPHGSSLTNLVFCRPGTVVVEITSPHYIRPYYWDISRQLGLNHLLVYADVLHCGPVRQVMSPNPLTEDLWIGDSTLNHILSYLATSSYPKEGDTLETTPVHRVQGSSMLPYLKEAIASCETAFQTQTDTFQTSRTLGNVLQAQGLFDEAMTWHTLSVHPSPNLAEVYSCFGQLYTSQNYWNEAIAAYQKAIAVNAKFAEAHWGLANVYSKLGDAEAEVHHRQQAIALRPQWQSAESQFLMGNAYLAQQSLDEAIAAYQMAVEQRPDFLEAHYNLGTALLRAQRYSDAIAAYKAALALKPDHAPAHHGIGSSCEALEEFENATHHYQQAIALEPDFSTYQRLGIVLKQQKRWAEAAEAFQQSIDLNADFPWAHYWLGVVSLRMNEPQQAISALQTAIQKKADAPQFHHTLGKALARVGQLDEAIAAYKQGIGLAADTEIDLCALGQRLRKRGYTDAAVTCYQQAIATDPKNHMPYVRLQYIPIHNHHLSQLIALYKRIQASGADYHPLLWTNLGDALSQQGQTEEAIAIYQQSCYEQITANRPKLAQVSWPPRKTQAPDFIIIGATKCGTTSLHEYLKRHPRILLPQRKELNFFLNRYVHQGKAWYLSHFPSITDEPGYYTGEASPNYFDSDGVEQRIYDMFPNIKLIALLRNPVDRAISAFHHRARDGAETRPLARVIADEIAELSDLTEEQLIQRSCEYQSSVFGGLYVYKLKRWLSVFPREQMLILKSENFFKNTSEAMQQVYDFLNIPSASIATRGKYNVGSYSEEESDVRQTLSNFFHPHTQRLEAYLGMNFHWD